MRYSCVERAGPTLGIRRRSLCASGFLCMHKTVRGARRMNVHARRTPEVRRARWTNARHTLGTRGAHAGHALCVRRLRPSAHLAHRQRTPSVLLKPATGRPYVRAFSLSGTVPAFTCDCLRFVCAFTPRPKVDLCVSTFSRTMLAFGNNVSFSSSACSTLASCRR